jgi:hypothetical protein
MPVVAFSSRDLLQGKLITPGWYRVRVDNVGEAPAKDQTKGPSTNYPVEGIVLFNGDNGDLEFANTPLTWNFNSKAIGFAVGFLKALGVDVKEGARYDLKAAEGHEIDVFVENGEYQNRMVNRVNHKYRPVRPEVTAMAMPVAK